MGRIGWRVAPVGALSLVMLAGSTARAEAPSVVTGSLTPASSRPPVDIARGFLAGRLDRGAGSLGSIALAPARVSARPDGGALVRFEQRLAGLPVVEGGAAVRVDPAGRVRWARLGFAAIPADFDATPAIDAARAYRIASGGALPADAARRARLVVRAPAGWVRPRLAWEISLPRDLHRMRQERVWVDAATGGLLGRVNRILDAAGHRARAYPENPVATPEQVEVVLGDIPAGGERLAGPDIEVSNCIDRRTCADLPTPGGGAISAHVCDVVPVARTNAAGNFLDIARPARDTDATDSFAEVQMYVHTTRAYAAFRELVGDPDFSLDGRPLTAIANFRLPTTACVGGAPPEGDELLPLDNAFFAPAGDLALFDRDVIAFGQGFDVDFSYDGDVVYHELGHAFVFRLNDLPFARVDDRGVDPTPAGLHEGYPDYLSSVITGDPRVGEYVGASINPALGAVRDLTNDATCPAVLSGESHIDSEPWSGALWQIREATAAGDRPALDRAVVTALAALGGDGSFADAAALTEAEIELALGRAAADAAAAVFRERGIDGCAGRIVDLRPGDRHDILVLFGYGAVPGPRVPAPVQFRVELSQPARALRFGKNVAASSDEVVLLVKPGGDPIQWRWSEAGGEDDAPIRAPLDRASDVDELAGDFPAGVYHLQVVSAEGTILTRIGVAPVSAGGEPDAGPTADAGAGGGDGDDGDGDDDGGSCAVAGRTGPGATALLLAIALLIGRRRPGREIERQHE